MKRVTIVTDDSGHDYVIPYELKDEFYIFLEILQDLNSDLECTDDFESEEYSMAQQTLSDAEEEFEIKFNKYYTGGDVDVELYANID